MQLSFQENAFIDFSLSIAQYCRCNIFNKFYFCSALLINDGNYTQDSRSGTISINDVICNCSAASHNQCAASVVTHDSLTLFPPSISLIATEVRPN